VSILLFIIIIAILILAHEFGHFIVAKRSGIRVDEFGIGFPPKLWGKKIGETEYTINLFPIGGFVKIFGETPDDDSIDGPDAKRSFVNKPKRVQAAVLAAGVFFNILLAWFLISTGFLIGLPTPVSEAPEGRTLQDVSVVVTGVFSGSPAEKAGLKVGDKILSLKAGESESILPSTQATQEFISSRSGENITVAVQRGKQLSENFTIKPEEGIIEKPAIGIAMDEIGTLRLPVHLALWEGAKLTASLTEATFLGLASFFGNLLTGNADLSSVAGPVGIVGIVGDASQFGFIYLLSLTALISINLAIINLIPFPALDGGRLLFLLIEAIKRSPIKPKIANTLNAIGFTLLLLLMVVITYNDILKLMT
jgi:regulator of sigma E protease